MPYLEAFMSLHDKDAELKGHKFMVQRKGKLPVKDSRSSEERAQEDLDVRTAASMVRVPTAPPAPGIKLLTQLRELGKVNLNWSCHLEPTRERNSMEDKPQLGQGNILCGDFQWE